LAKKPLKKTNLKQAAVRLKEQLLAAVEKTISPTQGLCVAYSGGLDSTVMLHLSSLVKQRHPALAISAFHVNHGLSEHANNWQEHCQQQASQRGIVFDSIRLQLQKAPQKSLEADARDARYAALSDYAKSTRIVLLAQHQDDQAETFVLQLKRGAGVKGLSAMPLMYRNSKGAHFARPLLGFSRQALLQFAQNESLSWIEDESNQDQSFDRNFIRQSIMPLLNKRWPQFTTTTARSASHCADTQEVVDEYMSVIRHKVLSTPTTLNVVELKAYSLPTQVAFLRFWLADFINLSPSAAQINTLTDMLANDASQSSHITLQNIIVEKSVGKLIVSPADTVAPVDVNFEWQGSAVRINENLVIEPVSLLNEHCFWLPFGSCSVRYGNMAHKVKMQSNRPAKSLKVWCQEWSVSTLQRQLLPIVWHQQDLIAVKLGESTKTASTYRFVHDADKAEPQLAGCWARFSL
jgi:tRNA(Ile)-lysidine synthase